MRIQFSTPPLLCVTRLAAGTQDQLRRLEAFLALDPFATDSATLRWSAHTTVVSTLSGLYGSMERILSVICEEIDGFLPSGPSADSAILHQVASPQPGVRPALFGEDLREALEELRAFRDRASRSYAIDIPERTAMAQLDRMRLALPALLQAVVDLDRYLSAHAQDMERPSGPT